MTKRILIVDDVPAVRAAVRAELEFESTFQVCGEAQDGLDGIKKARELKPDLVILDFAMPFMNGIQAATVLSREMPHVPLILFTMHAGAVVEMSARAAGISVVIPKAGQPQALLRGVRALLEEPRVRA